MIRRPLLPLPALAFTALAVSAPAERSAAQVPPGWCVVSAHKENNATYTGDGSIYLTHSRTPMAMLEVAGLPARPGGAVDVDVVDELQHPGDEAVPEFAHAGGHGFHRLGRGTSRRGRSLH